MNASTNAVLVTTERLPLHARASTGITANHGKPGERMPPFASVNHTATAMNSQRPARAARSVSPRRHSHAVRPTPLVQPIRIGSSVSQACEKGCSANSSAPRTMPYETRMAQLNTITRARRRTIGSPSWRAAGTQRSTNSIQPLALRPTSPLPRSGDRFGRTTP